MLKLLKQSFSKILFEKRIELKYSQEVMAEKCCISTRQYTDLEHGLRLPSFQTFINITIAFEIDYNVFLASLIRQGYKVPDKKLNN